MKWIYWLGGSDWRRYVCVRSGCTTSPAVRRRACTRFAASGVRRTERGKFVVPFGRVATIGRRHRSTGRTRLICISDLGKIRPNIPLFFVSIQIVLFSRIKWSRNSTVSKIFQIFRNFGKLKGVQREFLREILYKNIAIIATQHIKMYFVSTFGDFSHTVEWNSLKSVWQISLYIFA